MKKKYLILSAFVILLACICYLMRYIYINELKALDDDLLLTRNIIFNSYSLYARNKDKISFEEYTQNYIDNMIIASNLANRYYSKSYLPKYKVALLNDIDFLLHNVWLHTTDTKSAELMYASLENIYLELIKLESSRSGKIQIDQDEYTKLHNMIDQYIKEVEKLPQ